MKHGMDFNSMMIPNNGTLNDGNNFYVPLQGDNSIVDQATWSFNQ